MSMFDSVYVRCDCGKEVEFQSKAGKCRCDTFYTHNVPPVIAGNLDGNVLKCNCGKLVQINVQMCVSYTCT